jgi:hypothetical protein
VGWEHRLPEGISGVRRTAEGFEASLALPVDDDGFFGRECPSCERLFKMRADEWDALPDDASITCPYCGEQPDNVHDFITRDQSERTDAAINALAEQYIHDQVGKLFRGLETRRLRPGESGIEIRVSREQPPEVRSLPDYVEEKVRRTLRCDNCGTSYAVYGASAFCPVCGPRPAVATVVEAIERARLALGLEDALPEDLREQARAEGVFDRAAADAVKEVVTLFEVFARDQFAGRVQNHEDIVRKAGRGVFQRLTDADRLFTDHAGFSLAGAASTSTWDRLLVVFQQRHVLVHRQGIVDQDYRDRVSGARERVGQRLVISRREAEQALDALEAVVRAVANV